MSATTPLVCHKCWRKAPSHHEPCEHALQVATAAKVAALGPVEEALRKNPLIAMFLDQGFWHAHHVDLTIRYNGEDRKFEADWLKDIWYAVRERQATTGAAS